MFRTMVNVMHTLLSLAMLTAMGAAQAVGTDMNAEAQNSATAVSNVFGSPASMNSGLAQPLNTAGTMSTVNGATQFGTNAACPAASQYLQVTMATQSTGDLANLALAWNPNLGATYTQTIAIGGPISGVCNNGLIRCDAGTFNNCSFLQWQASTTSIGLVAVQHESLGACYCINNYCGANLVANNAKKVLSDIGGGIRLALNAVWPRLAISQSGTQPDPAQIVYYANSAGCNATGPAPESYFNNASTSSMPAAGQAIASDPTSTYNMVLNSPAATGQTSSPVSCTLQRQIGLNSISKTNVVQVLSKTAGTTYDCGSGCLQVQLGAQGINYWSGGTCSVFQDNEKIQISGSQYLTSAKLVNTTYDDWMQVLVNGSLVWVDPSQWTDITVPVNFNQGWSCDTGRQLVSTPNLNLMSAFGKNGTVTVTNRTSVGGEGEGWSIIEFHVNEACTISSNTITDGCSGYESKPDCQLESEIIDGVQTVNNYMSTGLQPLASTQNISGACNYGPMTEPWWKTQRVYVCNAGNTTYDFSDTVARYNSVASTLNTSTGDYTDRTVTQPGGTPTFSNGNAPLPPPQPAACFQQCETTSAPLGPAVGDQSGPVSTLNTTGTAQSYSFRECSTQGTCPLNPGETIVSDCACTNDFNKAATSMQLMRMMEEDAVCLP